MESNKYDHIQWLTQKNPKIFCKNLKHFWSLEKEALIILVRWSKKAWKRTMNYIQIMVRILFLFLSDFYNVGIKERAFGPLCLRFWNIYFLVQYEIVIYASFVYSSPSHKALTCMSFWRIFPLICYLILWNIVHTQLLS